MAMLRCGEHAREQRCNLRESTRVYVGCHKLTQQARTRVNNTESHVEENRVLPNASDLVGQKLRAGFSDFFLHRAANVTGYNPEI